MKFAIIAAGEGSRLAAEGIQEPKPLVRVGGERLIDRLIRIFLQHDADEIVCICNNHTCETAQHLKDLQRDGLYGRPVPLRFVVKSTPSSMHSFFEISRYLQDGPFVLTTVDTIFREDEFADYLRAFCRYQGDALMGVTEYIDDERPLYVQTDDQLSVTAFLDKSSDCRYISAGIYGLQPSTLVSLSNSIARREHRMRNFQRALLSDGYKVAAWPFSKVLDIDHACDIRKAEEMLGMVI
jgi:NDP-sugar pyrophosphorylase family protein